MKHKTQTSPFIADNPKRRVKRQAQDALGVTGKQLRRMVRARKRQLREQRESDAPRVREICREVADGQA